MGSLPPPYQMDKDQHVYIPPPLDLSHHYSYTTKNRQASSVKNFYKYFQIPGIHNLAGGLPHVSYFPYDTLEATVALPQRFKPTPNIPVGPPEDDVVDVASLEQPASARVMVPKESGATDLIKKIDLSTALQYGTAEGYPPLRAFIKQFVRQHLHPNVPYAGGPDVILSCGSTDGFSKALEAFTNVWNKDRDWIRDREGIVCEEFAYMNAIQTAKPKGLNIVGIAVDEQGMMASGEGGLADVLDNWDFRKGRRPHLMYTVTIGQNPTGGTLSVERRKEIYALCQKYDIIIIEDDPYWNLQFPSAYSLAKKYRGDSTGVNLYNRNYNSHGKSSGYEFLDSLVPSYLSLDTDGRVVRLDTFSKTIAPGCRLGWITAQPAIIERLTRIAESSTQQPSGFVQAMVAKMIMGPEAKEQSGRDVDLQGKHGWKMDGWVRWLEGLRGAYERRMQDMCTALEEGKYIVQDSTDRDLFNSMGDLSDWEVVNKVKMFDFVWPMAGMFVWMKICIDTHPLFSQLGGEKLCKALWIHLTRKPYLCLVAPGQMFAPTQKTMDIAYQYMRLCFAPMAASDVTEASQKTVEGFKAFWQIKDPKDIDDHEESMWDSL
ncbi:hypothetical protein DTO166G4_1289 [Paecilomyces variotii]|nr:hypothetical protein DTO166G4_1289 [Paecilomyces variotii]KAJ9242288.1 hypothetical protein DTO166G5_691 [Paecilomyces variotii]KAJ9304178.1 hypothetical protein DTO217A2_6395 [Paecilomyces variotii]KAJ9353206.1 hypothetical protein DTO027B9_5458 [Paecilomyces variotii]